MLLSTDIQILFFQRKVFIRLFMIRVQIITDLIQHRRRYTRRKRQSRYSVPMLLKTAR